MCGCLYILETFTSTFIWIYMCVCMGWGVGGAYLFSCCYKHKLPFSEEYLNLVKQYHVSQTNTLQLGYALTTADC